MGITGTEVAKDAADIILLDDNFSSIVNGVEEELIIFDHLTKSSAYTLSYSSYYTRLLEFLFPLTTVVILMVDLGNFLIFLVLLFASPCFYFFFSTDIFFQKTGGKELFSNSKLSFSFLWMG